MDAYDIPEFACQALVMTAAIPGGKAHISVDACTFFTSHVNTLNLGCYPEKFRLSSSSLTCILQVICKKNQIKTKQNLCVLSMQVGHTSTKSPVKSYPP